MDRSDGREGRTRIVRPLRPEVHLPRYFLSGKDAPFAVAALFALEAPIGLLAAMPLAATTHSVPFVQARNRSAAHQRVPVTSHRYLPKTRQLVMHSGLLRVRAGGRHARRVGSAP